MELMALCFFAGLAGFVDSIAGGGGLIQLPALLLFLPGGTSAGLGPVFGTNKFASIWGTSMSMAMYMRRIQLNWGALLPTSATAFVFAFFGSRAVSMLDPAKVKPFILLLMIVVAVYTALRKDFGNVHAPKLAPGVDRWIGAAIGAAIGFYDGFFGPGAGSFLIFLFIGVFGFDFLSASASAKTVNVATNLASVTYFAATGSIQYHYAIPMAVSNSLGSFCGSRLAILKGNRFVRVLFLAIITALIGKLGWDMAR